MWYNTLLSTCCVKKLGLSIHMLQNSAQKEMYAKVGTVNNVM